MFITTYAPLSISCRVQLPLPTYVPGRDLYDMSLIELCLVNVEEESIVPRFLMWLQHAGIGTAAQNITRRAYSRRLCTLLRAGQQYHSTLPVIDGPQLFPISLYVQDEAP